MTTAVIKRVQDAIHEWDCIYLDDIHNPVFIHLYSIHFVKEFEKNNLVCCSITRRSTLHRNNSCINIRVGKTGSLGPWRRVIVHCSKLFFCQNDWVMGESFWQKDSLLQYTMTLRQGPQRSCFANPNKNSIFRFFLTIKMLGNFNIEIGTGILIRHVGQSNSLLTLDPIVKGTRSLQNFWKYSIVLLTFFHNIHQMWSIKRRAESHSI